MISKHTKTNKKINIFFYLLIYLNQIKCHMYRLYTVSKWCQISKKVDPGTILKNKIFYRDGFQKIILPGTKTQTRYICRDQKHILTVYKWLTKKNQVWLVYSIICEHEWFSGSERSCTGRRLIKVSHPRQSPLKTFFNTHDFSKLFLYKGTKGSTQHQII